MGKLFKYEMHRLLANKFFAGLMVITLLYSYFVLSGDIILGISNTAPFSGWSYGWFLTQILPLLLVTLLFFVSFLFTNKEKQVQVLVKATSVEYPQYMLFRCLAMIIGFLLISAVAVLVSMVFYLTTFKFAGFGGFVLPLILTLLPPMFLALGLGLILGRLHQGTLYALMLVFLVLGQVSLAGFDLLGAGFYANYPISIWAEASVEPAFTVPASFWLSRGIISGAGIALMIPGILLMTRIKKDKPIATK